MTPGPDPDATFGAIFDRELRKQARTLIPLVVILYLVAFIPIIVRALAN